MCASSLTDQFVEFGPGRCIHALVSSQGASEETPKETHKVSCVFGGSSKDTSRDISRGTSGGTSGGGVVVFFPGNGGSVADFKPVMERLASRFEVVGLDFPGRSETRWPDVRFDFMSDLHPVIDWSLSQLGVGMHFVFGHGSGGLVALEHAKRHHGQVQGIGLLESYLNANIQQQTTSRKHRRPIRFDLHEQAAFQKRRMRHSLWLNEHLVFRESFIASQKGYDAQPWINELEIPMQVFVADSGQLLPREEDISSWQHQLGMTEVVNLEIVKVPDSGHWLMLDDPDLVAQKIEGFIEQTKAYGSH